MLCCAVLLCTGIFVAFVPQGLPATVTMLLTFAAMRLKDRNVLVKDLTAVRILYHTNNVPPPSPPWKQHPYLVTGGWGVQSKSRRLA